MGCTCKLIIAFPSFVDTYNFDNIHEEYFINNVGKH